MSYTHVDRGGNIFNYFGANIIISRDEYTSIVDNFTDTLIVDSF